MGVPDAETKKSSAKIEIVSMPTLKSMKIVPALASRSWMSRLDESDLWLPTSTANQTGWMILNDQEVEVTWNGGRAASDIRVVCRPQGPGSHVVSRFGNGVVTWEMPFFFRLRPEFNLRLRGLTNSPKEGAFPIEQILDADSIATGVSMSWRITRIGAPVRFELEEPLCMFYAELRSLAAELDPQIQTLEEVPSSSTNADSSSKTEAASGLPIDQRECGREAHDAGENASLVRSVRETWDQDLSSHPQEPRAQENHHDPLKIEDRPRARGKLGDSTLLVAPFFIQNDFYDQASTLRSQFERVASAVSSMDPSVNPFLYAYTEHAYQIITATAERIFTADLLFSLLDRLRAWASQNLRVTHASTPRVQVCIGGSRRHFAKDDIRARWHYLLSLTRNEKHADRVKVLVESGCDDLDGVGAGVTQVTTLKLTFNELLVHDARRAYGIHRSSGSINPAKAIVLLDGYLW